MLFVFPCDYFDHKQPDGFYAGEYELAGTIGAERLLIDFDRLLGGCDPFGSFEGKGQTFVWRGWQMPASVYGSFCDCAAYHGLVPLTDAEAYAACHELERAYDLCGEHMSPTAFVTVDDVDENTIEQVFEELKCERLFVKDLVKGAYDRPCMLDRDHPDDWICEIERLKRDRGDALTEDLVFKAWVDGFHGETRFFVIDGKICCAQGHAGGDGEVDVSACQAVLDESGISAVSRFFTIDMALDSDGNAFVVETGDGQVSECDSTCAVELIGALVKLD